MGLDIERLAGTYNFAPKDPFTLGNAVARAARSFGTRPGSRRDALGHAVWASRHDPSMRVCATYGVERAVDLTWIGAAASDGLNARWRGGRPTCDTDAPTPLRAHQVNDLMAVGPTATAAVIDALWVPRTRSALAEDWLAELGLSEEVEDAAPDLPAARGTRLYLADLTRMPIEATATAAALIGCEQDGHVVVVDPGFGTSAQALSVFAPFATIHHHRPGAHPAVANTDRTRGFAAVVINLPSAVNECFLKVVENPVHTEAVRPWRLARDLRREMDIAIVHDAAEHLVDHVADLAIAGTGSIVVLVGDCDSGAHHHAARLLEQRFDLERHPATRDRAIYVRHPARPWAPHRCPAVTDRLVSAWRVR